MPDELLVRTAARVLLIDDSDRVLLFRWDIPGADTHDGRARRVWITPGGGLHAGESWEAGALRELYEETGIADLPLGPAIWERNVVFKTPGRLFEQRERFFLVRTPALEISTANFEPHEVDSITAHRWWSLPEMESATETLVPTRFASLLPSILRGDLPDQPIDVGR